MKNILLGIAILLTMTNQTLADDSQQALVHLQEQKKAILAQQETLYKQQASLALKIEKLDRVRKNNEISIDLSASYLKFQQHIEGLTEQIYKTNKMRKSILNAQKQSLEKDDSDQASEGKRKLQAYSEYALEFKPELSAKGLDEKYPVSIEDAAELHGFDLRHQNHSLPFTLQKKIDQLKQREVVKTAPPIQSVTHNMKEQERKQNEVQVVNQAPAYDPQHVLSHLQTQKNLILSAKKKLYQEQHHNWGPRAVQSFAHVNSFWGMIDSERDQNAHYKVLNTFFKYQDWLDDLSKQLVKVEEMKSIILSASETVNELEKHAKTGSYLDEFRMRLQREAKDKLARTTSSALDFNPTLVSDRSEKRFPMTDEGVERLGHAMDSFFYKDENQRNSPSYAGMAR